MTVPVGIIGVGVMGADHARKLNGCAAGAQVSAIADVNGEAAAAVAGEMHNATVRANGLDLIASADVDAVLIAVRGRYIYEGEFAKALELLDRGVVDIAPLTSGERSISEGPAAFAEMRQAADLVKVLLHSFR